MDMDVGVDLDEKPPCFRRYGNKIRKGEQKVERDILTSPRIRLAYSVLKGWWLG